MRIKLTPLLALLRLLDLTCLGGPVYTSPAMTNPPPSVSLAWDPSPDPTCTGYNIYIGVASRTYTNFVSVSGGTTLSVSNLVRGVTYYFTATATYAGPLESDFCNEVSYTPKLPAKPGSLRNPIALVVQSKAIDPAAQWADAGMDWSLTPDQANQVFRLMIVATDAAAPAPTATASPQTRALAALRIAMAAAPPSPN